MQPAGEQLPSVDDCILPESSDLDERSAVEYFHGKTIEQAEALFRENFLWYQVFLGYLRAPAFQFYMRAATNYIRSESASGDSDAANTFYHCLKRRLEKEPEAIQPIKSLLAETIREILLHFDRYNCLPEFYGDIPAGYRELLKQLEE